ncbi:MAG: TlyA family RNA methyltransferase [Defluviicoccus sp.]|nr:TlyA family RNA methyltransferase [Defluviicoccus sp.]
MASPSPPKSRRRRLDALVEARGLAASRTEAQALIRAGKIWSGDRRLDKPGHGVAADAALELRGGADRWASRGGFKLDHALVHFDIDVAGAVALDIGASTGGFTDVLLARGAERVYAVDVGRGQMLWRLRQDERVAVLDRLNARYISDEHVPEPVDAVVCDASFIGLETILPAPLALAAPGAWLVALIKPQFEVGRGAVGKGGIVRDAAARDAACQRIAAWLAAREGWRVLGLIESPIEGAGGNREYLIAGARA